MSKRLEGTQPGQLSCTDQGDAPYLILPPPAIKQGRFCKAGITQRACGHWSAGGRG